MSSGQPPASAAADGAALPPVRRLLDLALSDAVTRAATWLELRLDPAGVAVYYGLPAGSEHAMQIPPAAAHSILTELLGRLGRPVGTPLPVAGTLTIRTQDVTASGDTRIGIQDGIPVVRVAIVGQTASTGPAAAT
ncbi:MAG: hypothetical protein IPG75_10130 [Gemmatimonadetes bacterium]|nr:hypothetical protein [Gemmatimonadota bacterium]